MRRLMLTVLLLTNSNPLLAQNIALTPAQQAAVGIELAPLDRAGHALSRPYPAQVRVPNEQLRVVATPQDGVIEALLVAEGEVVTAGQPLARLLSPGLLDLQRDYLDALTRKRLAADAMNRDRTLFKEGIVAQRRALESAAAYQEQAAAVDRSRQALELAGMAEADLQRLEQERKLHSDLTVRAPLAGVVLEQLATAGQRVERAGPLYRVARLNPLWIEAHVPLEAAQEVHPGDAVLLSREGLTGTVVAVGRMVHEADQGVLVRAEVSEGTDALRPGQFVEVQFSDDPAGALRVPSSAVVRHQGRTYLFIGSADGLTAVPVEEMQAEGDTVLVRGELPAAARIVIQGTAAAKAAWLGSTE